MSNAQQSAPVGAPMTVEQLKAELTRLQAENAALASKQPKETTKVGHGLSLRVSPKGAISIYGVGRWPITIYRQTFDKIVAALPEIQAFVAANTEKLVLKLEE